MSIDPLAEKYNWMSCYQFASNQVIHGREIEGLENDNDLNYDDLDESYLNFYGGYRVYGIDLFDNNNEQIHTPNMDLNEVVVEGSRGMNYDNDEELDDFTGFDNQDFGWDDEYDAAKEAQGLLELRISKMEEVYSNARLIDESQLDMTKALVLSNVKIKNQANGMEMKYTLVAESEADLKTGKISVTSPIGKGLLGKSVGDIAEITVPNGILKFEVLEISRD
jgi:transcription elongation factor GreA